MIHVDAKKLETSADGGGRRYLGRVQGDRTVPPPLASPATGTTTRRSAPRSCTPSSMTTPASPTQRSTTTRPPPPQAWFTARGVTVERVLSGNGSALPVPRLARRLHRPRHPTQEDPSLPPTNERRDRTLHRTLAAGWAFARMLPTESARRHALPAWLHEYNHHRPHTAISNVPPITRLTNLPRQFLPTRSVTSIASTVSCPDFPEVDQSRPGRPAAARRTRTSVAR